MPVNLRNRRRRPADEGAVGVTFGVLVASGVLLGALAIVVDVGRLYAERTELQNGADSAALALARACADGAPACGSLDEALALAAHYAGANASDGKSTVDVCGAVPGVLPPCGPQPENLTGCLGVPPVDRYVEVHVSTLMSDDSTVLPRAIAMTVAGGGSTVGACARAAWSDLSVLALTIDECIYEGSPQLPPDAGLSDEDERPIQFWQWEAWDPEQRYPATCGTQPETPNIAGLLDGADADCEIAMADDGRITGTFFEFVPGGVASGACVSRLQRAIAEYRESGTVIYLPVYTSRTPDDANPELYHFEHTMLAPFAVTAFQFGAPPSCGSGPLCDYDFENYRQGSWVPGTHYWIDMSSATTRLNSPGPCGTPEVGHRCLTGVFVGPPIPISSLTGASSVRLVG